MICINYFRDKPLEHSVNKSTTKKVIENRLSNHIKAINDFVNHSPEYNRYIAFFIDMRIHSGKNRFFVVDLSTKKVIDKGLVAHGSGSETGMEGELKFSNTNNSYCTSLGKYSIGKSYYGQFGKAYKLYGLDETNDNAFSRTIVLHKYETMPYEEQEQSICNSLGCPMVNERFYKRLEEIIDHSEKDIILEIYY
jgi:hypothetical protein